MEVIFTSIIYLMKDKILFFLKYILFWIGIHFFFRLVFLLLYGHLAEEISFRDSNACFCLWI